MTQTLADSKLAHEADTELVLSLINDPTSTGNLFLPGISAASTAVLVENLKHNYLHNDAFFKVCFRDVMGVYTVADHKHYLKGAIFHKYASRAVLGYLS